MYSKEEKQFLEMNLKLRNELGEIEKKIDDLEERRVFIIHLLDGEVEQSEDIVLAETNDEENVIDRWLVQFLVDHPGSQRKSIVEALSAKGYSRHAIDKSIKRCKTYGVIENEGTTRNTKWYAKEGE